MVEKIFRFEAIPHWQRKMFYSVDAPHLKKPICETSQPLGNTLDLFGVRQNSLQSFLFVYKIQNLLRGLNRPCTEPKMVQKR